MKRLILAVLFVCVASKSYGTTVLYDGGLGGTPEDQGWHLFEEYQASFSQSEVGGVTNFSTTGSGWAWYETNDSRNGSTYSHPAMSTLSIDRSGGYILDFTLKVNDPSPLVYLWAIYPIDQYGVALSFGEDSIVDLFTSTEVSFDAEAQLVEYSLIVSDDSYALYGDESFLLSGSLSYMNFSDTIINDVFVRIGDTASNDYVNADLSYVAITPIPEPLTMISFMVSMCGLFFRKFMLSGKK